MDQAELVEAIGDVLTDLDQLTISPEVNADPALKQLVAAVRNHLDDQQRELVKETIDADTVEFKTQTGVIALATDQLQKQLDEMDKIDDIVKTVSQISASLDAILKAVP